MLKTYNLFGFGLRKKQSVFLNSVAGKLRFPVLSSKKHDTENTFNFVLGLYDVKKFNAIIASGH